MTVTCSTCGYDTNPIGTEFCEACGSELEVAVDINSAPTTLQNSPEIHPPTTPLNPTPEPIDIASPSGLIAARLISKHAAPISEFSLDGSNALVGRFDPDSGPVDVDLDGFPGEETVSRGHAEIYAEAGLWKVKDIGSTNGVFIKRSGQSRFEARITIPETLKSGDEIAFGKIRFLFQSP